jgi:hypothetical protein
MAGEAAHEGEAQTCAHTKPTWRLQHRAESFSQQRSLGSQAERRRARLGRRGTEEQSGFTGLVNADARAWVHGCVNVKKGVRMRMPASRPLAAVETAAATQ